MGDAGSTGVFGSIKNYLQHQVDIHGQLYALAATCILIIISIILKNLFLYLSYYVSVPVRSSITAGFRKQYYCWLPHQVVSKNTGFAG